MKQSPITLQTPIQRLRNLSDSELIDLANALRYFCPASVDCLHCPLYCIDHDVIAELGCIALQAEREYFNRIAD